MRLRVANLSKEFYSERGRVEALRNVSFEVEEGEIFVLLGPSGSGKSTILNLIAGIEKPSAGEIWFGDRLVASPKRGIFVPPRERNVAMVFQSYALYPHMSVFDNIAFPLRVIGVNRKEIERSVREVASLLDIFDLLKAKPAELSGGQRQRVAIARALVRKPNLFLLDEPLSNLDAQLRLHTRIELKRLVRKLKITTLYVTHDQSEAMSLGDRILLLREGRVEQIGSPRELYEEPANRFVATFVGSPPMNLIRARLLKEKGGLFIAIGSYRLKLPEGKVLLLKGTSSREILVGIRPEHMRLNPPDGGVLKGKVIYVDYMGREILLQVSTHAGEIFLLSEPIGIKEGENVTIGIDPHKVHLFED